MALAAAALALGACGGDDGGNGAAPPAPARPSSPRTAARDGDHRRHDDGDHRAGTHGDERGPHDERRSEGGDDSGGGIAEAARRQRLEQGGSGGNDDSGSKAQPAAQPGNVFKIAETVCNSFLPKQIERDLENGKSEPEDVARDYSRGFPDKQREARVRRLPGRPEARRHGTETRKGGSLRTAPPGQPGSSICSQIAGCAVRRLRHEDSLPQEGSPRRRPRRSSDSPRRNRSRSAPRPGP